ncbi:BlaI/MecI/CopY family transcriptional regulator [Eubacteriales bacterium OttesenSCG-928-A19]|nr:BlaI/MecI/CopY family transcriptional regulator [Eubacteriales bacterium OttesenSCG-928-A19]
MPKKKGGEFLTQREIDVLNILWNAKTHMVASEIVKTSEALSINTVQAVLRDLLQKGLVEVAEIVYSGKVLSRSYRATEISRQQMSEQFATRYKELTKGIPPSMLFAAMFDDSDVTEAEINELEMFIREKKDALRRG